jgi:hypothetical protein
VEIDYPIRVPTDELAQARAVLGAYDANAVARSGNTP